MDKAQVGKLTVGVVDTVLVLVALGVGGMLFHNLGGGNLAVGEVRQLPDSVEWERTFEEGHRVGPSDAIVTFVEFADFQCAVCAYMHSEIARLSKQFEGQIAVIYRHFPLANHAAAVEAALAAECAANQQMFASFSAALYGNQQWIGVNEWVEFGRMANVPNLQESDDCIRERDFIDRVRSDIIAARELGVRMTPAFLVDGTLMMGVSSARLERALREALDRRRANTDH